jgi:hypothetical protein
MGLQLGSVLVPVSLIMDKLIDQLEKLTNTMIDQLDTASYEGMEQFVEERQNVIDIIGDSIQAGTVTEQQKGRIQILLQHDSSIVYRMQILKNEARDWLQHRNVAKAQRSAYDSAYSPESILMDRKK